MGNASSIKGSVGYGERMGSFWDSLESDNATSAEAEDFLFDDHNETSVAGVELRDDVQNLSTSCTMEDCDLDPIESTPDGILNLEILGDDADDYLEIAWARRGVARRTTRRVIRRRLIWRCWWARVRVCGWRPIVR